MRLAGVRTAGAAALLAGFAAFLVGGCSLVASTTPAPRFTDVPSATLAPTPTQPPPGTVPTPTPSPTPTAVPTQSGPTPVPIYAFNIVANDYGYLVLEVAPGSSCSATIAFPDGSNRKLDPKTAGPDSKVEWRYPTPTIPDGRAHTVVICTLNGKTATESGDFQTVP